MKGLQIRSLPTHKLPVVIITLDLLILASFLFFLPSDTQTTSNTPKLPSSLSNWFSSGIQELEREKTIPSGTGKALQSFQQSNPSEMLKICKAISKDPSADIKLADCNSLQGGGEKAEELR